jgi:hypothetical protein
MLVVVIVMVFSATFSYIWSLNTKKTTTYGVANSDPGLGEAQQCGRVKPVNGISNFLCVSSHIRRREHPCYHSDLQSTPLLCSNASKTKQDYVWMQNLKESKEIPKKIITIKGLNININILY